MNAIECLTGRRSIREFTDEPVSAELLSEIVDIARFAPSWKNTQIARYVALTGAKKDELSNTAFKLWAGNSTIINNAPVAIVLTYVKNRSGFERDGSYTTTKEDRWQNFDCGIAAEAFCLSAYEKGLGTVILGIFDESEVAKVLDLPEDRGVAAIIAVGHPTSHPDAPRRKEVSELLTIM